METKLFEILAAQSNIDWKGRKITGEHYGTIAIKKGTLCLQDGRLAGGTFVIDTRSVKILDITDPLTNAQFAGHLASDDFFGSEQYPEALFVITSAEPKGNDGYFVKGDLTIKGITQPVEFDARVNTVGDTLTASGMISVDRTLYGMKFRSGNFFRDLGDTLIYNEFDLTVYITARAAVQNAVSPAQHTSNMKNSEQEKAAITGALENVYFKGIYEGNLNLLHQVYYTGTLLFGDVKGQPYAKSLDQYLDGVKNRQSPKDSGKSFKGEILSIKVVNSIAIAEVRVKMYDFNYHEYLSLHKLDGRWLIVNKMISDTNE